MFEWLRFVMGRFRVSVCVWVLPCINHHGRVEVFQAIPMTRCHYVCVRLDDLKHLYVKLDGWKYLCVRLDDFIC